MKRVISIIIITVCVVGISFFAGVKYGYKKYQDEVDKELRELKDSINQVRVKAGLEKIN